MHKNFKSFGVVLIFSAISFLPVTAEASQPIGYIEAITGDVTMTIDRPEIKQTPQSLSEEDFIYVDSVIATDKGERVTIRFEDDSVITVAGEDGYFKVEDYAFDLLDPEKNKAKYSVLRASFEYVGGQISDSQDKLRRKSNTEINLDFGSIGIRGTTLYRAMNGTECWIYLEDGKVDVYNNAGFVTLNPGDGTRLVGANLKPLGVRPWSKQEIKWIKSTVSDRILPPFEYK